LNVGNSQITTIAKENPSSITHTLDTNPTEKLGLDQNIYYIIIGTFCCIALILIVAIIAQRMYIRRVRRNEERERRGNAKLQDERNKDQVSNPYYGVEGGSNSLETYGDFSSNPYYERSNPESDIYGDVTNPYYGR
jgi:flagellar biosynthesis/type III secretory pathway M-ring protein FliF/YscJ